MIKVTTRRQSMPLPASLQVGCGVPSHSEPALDLNLLHRESSSGTSSAGGSNCIGVRRRPGDGGRCSKAGAGQAAQQARSVSRQAPIAGDQDPRCLVMANVQRTSFLLLCCAACREEIHNEFPASSPTLSHLCSNEICSHCLTAAACQCFHANHTHTRAQFALAPVGRSCCGSKP